MAKYVKVGQVLNVTGEDGETRRKVKLGQENSKDPKYDYTVQIRVLNADGEVVYKTSNPWIDVKTPHENAPKTILNELQIYVKEETQA
jgi:hypothetical protein